MQSVALGEILDGDDLRAVDLAEQDDAGVDRLMTIRSRFSAPARPCRRRNRPRRSPPWSRWRRLFAQPVQQRGAGRKPFSATRRRENEIAAPNEPFPLGPSSLLPAPRIVELLRKRKRRTGDLSHFRRSSGREEDLVASLRSPERVSETGSRLADRVFHRPPKLHRTGVPNIGPDQGCESDWPFLSSLPQIRRHGLLGQRCNRLVRAHRRLRVRAQATDGHRILARLLAADGDERRDLRQRVLPHLVVDLLVAQMGLDPQAPLLRLCRDGKLPFVTNRRDRADDDGAAIRFFSTMWQGAARCRKQPQQFEFQKNQGCKNGGGKLDPLHRHLVISPKMETGDCHGAPHHSRAGYGHRSTSGWCAYRLLVNRCGQQSASAQDS